MGDNVKLVVVGSAALDSIETTKKKVDDILGGSVSYACAAASFFTKPGMVATVGDDFPSEYMDLYKEFEINTEGFKQVEGKTFRWSGVYEENMNNRRTLSLDLNVFETFSPELPDSYRQAPFVFLGNISPELQLKVLSQISGAKCVIADTIDFWIENAKDALVEVISKIDILAINDSEAQLLTGLDDLSACGKKILEMGPSSVVIKLGEHGSLLVSGESEFKVPAYKVDDCTDPTGAGDTFAGAFMGKLAQTDDISEESVKDALYYGSAVASFVVEDFSLDGLKSLTIADIEERVEALKNM